MKKILLLSVLLIFACSSDDSNDSNQTFLEKYNGILWEPTSEIGWGEFGLIYFLNQDCFLYNYNACECYPLENLTIITNQNNELRYTLTIELQETQDGPVTEVITTYQISVSEDESVMQVVFDSPVGIDMDQNEVTVIGVFNKLNSPNNCL